MDEKQDSNNVGLFVARETTNRVLADPAAFDTREPNSFDDFGGDYKSVARRPFNPSRQRKKGTIVDLDANGGWNEDLTQNNMRSVFDAFCFAAERRKPHAENVAAVAASDDYTVASSTGFLVGSIVLGKNFDNAANNGIHVLNGITDATHVSTADALTDEAASPLQSVEVVGYQFPAADVVATVVGAHYILTSAAINPTTLGLIPGEWVFVGGENATANQLAANQVGYARVYSVSATQIVFDQTTFAAAPDDGVGTTLRIFFGSVIKNEDDPDDIVKYTHTVERTLGRDDDGRQSEYIDGYVYNELTWNSPLTDKVSIDIKGVGMSHTTRTGAEGPVCEDGTNTIAAALSEDAFNTSSNVYRLRMAVLDGTLNPTGLFARVSEFNAKINNNVSGAKAQGTLGAFDSTAGGFDVDIEATAYFSGVGAIATIRENDDVNFNAIYSKQNAAIIMDIPLIQNGGGRLTVDMDKPIMVPLKSMAAESPFGHTILFNFLPYVPTVGMATGA